MVFEAAADGACIIAFDGCVIDANPAACAMHGYSRAEFVGRYITQIIVSEYRATFDALVTTVQRTGHAGGRLVHMRHDGSLLTVSLRATTMTFQNHLYLLVLLRDVTEQIKLYELLDQSMQERTHEMETLLDLSRKVAATLELKPILSLLIDALKDMVDYDSASLSIRDGDYFVSIDYKGMGSVNELVKAGVMAEARFRVDVYRPGWETYQRGRAVIIDDLAGDTPIAIHFRAAAGSRVEAMLKARRSWMGVPMILKGEVVGVLVLTSPQPHHFTERHERLALAIAAQAATAVENARLYAEARKWAALEERQRLARELHDSVSQALYGIVLGTHTARVLLERDPSPTSLAAPLGYIMEQAEAALAEMRALIFELRPEALATEGLIVALRKQAESVAVRHKLAITTALVDEPEVPAEVKEAVFRIAQEALHNMVKHAQARHASVALALNDGCIVLDITDDGVGFNPQGAFPGHLGMQTMRERAMNVGGELDVTSTPGTGTHIRVRIPARDNNAISPR